MASREQKLVKEEVDKTSQLGSEGVKLDVEITSRGVPYDRRCIFAISVVYSGREGDIGLRKICFRRGDPAVVRLKGKTASLQRF